MNAFAQTARSSLVALGLLFVVVAGAAPIWAADDPFVTMDVDRAGLPVPAPDLAFRSLDGQEVRLRDLRGRVVLLGFFTTS
jgi:cytochrome oxidase Cu insertion factor (SCO1/SenC/PrrC family)